MPEISNGALKSAFGFATSAIATEHFFSATLSSPVSVKSLKQDPTDVRNAYVTAIILSLLIAIPLSIILKNWLPLITTVVIIAIYISQYEKALAGKSLALI